MERNASDSPSFWLLLSVEQRHVEFKNAVRTNGDLESYSQSVTQLPASAPEMLANSSHYAIWGLWGCSGLGWGRLVQSITKLDGLTARASPIKSQISLKMFFLSGSVPRIDNAENNSSHQRRRSPEGEQGKTACWHLETF